MKRQTRRTLCRGVTTVMLLGGLAVVAASCNDDDVSGVGTLISAEISSESTPEPVQIGPTLAPESPPTISPREEPDFAPVTPPPIVVDLPPQPQAELDARQDFASLQYELRLTDILVRGEIADVDVQAINITCGTDVTDVLNESAVQQFESFLIGRGNLLEESQGANANTPENENGVGFDFEYIFPTDITFFEDGRILSKGERNVPTGFDDMGMIEFEEDELTGDDIVFYVTITDSFGQVLLLADSIFEPDEERLGFPCGGFLALLESFGLR